MRQLTLVEFADARVREAYVAGAKEAADPPMLDASVTRARELEEWIGELDAWAGGQPPPAPHLRELERYENGLAKISVSAYPYGPSIVGLAILATGALAFLVAEVLLKRR